MWAHLEPGSSPVDWCESNYSISPNIAEFGNTVSNVLFFLFPPLLIHLFRDYSRLINPAINLLWLLLMVVGISSAYFHATLSLVGQLLDELAILWVCTAAFGMFLPKRHFPKFLEGNRRVFGFYCVIFSIVATSFLAMYPAANAFALMTFTVPAIGLLFDELCREKCVRVHRLGLRCVGVCLLAMSCWVVDRVYCDTFLSINFPYLHALWHIFISISGYTCLVLLAYFNVSQEHPGQRPQLRYWPRNSFELGIPYVVVKRSETKDNEI